MDTRIGGEDWEAWGCYDPRLVGLVIRYDAWRADEKNAPWHDTPAQPLAEPEASAAVIDWMVAQPTA